MKLNNIQNTLLILFVILIASWIINNLNNTVENFRNLVDFNNITDQKSNMIIKNKNCSECQNEDGTFIKNCQITNQGKKYTCEDGLAQPNLKYACPGSQYDTTLKVCNNNKRVKNEDICPDYTTYIYIHKEIKMENVY